MPIEYTIIISLVSVTCTILGVGIGMSNLRRNQRADTQREGASIALLAHIEKSVEAIQGAMKEQRDRLVRLIPMEEHLGRITHDMEDIKQDSKEHRDRLVRVEESAKHAHKRLDEIVGRRASGGSE